MNALQKLALLAPSVLALVGCEPPTRQAPPPPVVVVATPEVREVQSSKVFVGTTDAAEFVEIRARVTGFLSSVDFEPASLVEKDQLLFTIEPDLFEAGVATAEASLAIAKAELARAENDLERVETAVQTNAVSKQEVGLRRADRDKAAASVQSAEAALRTANLDLSYTEIRSPIAGRVGRELVTVGNLVGASGQTTLLTTVAATKPIYVYFDAPERFLVQRLRQFGGNLQAIEQRERNLSIRIQLEGDEGFPHEGHIDFIDNRVDAATGTVSVRGELLNEDLLVYPGLFARVQILGDPIPDAVLVEETAIGTDLGGKFVLVIGEGNVVERRYLELGDTADGRRVALEGIDGATTYIVEGLVKARPGLPVRPMTREQAAAARKQADANPQQGR